MIEALVRRRVLTTVLVLIAVILGAVSYAAIGLRRFPDIEFPFATVVTSYPGGSPSEIETEITKRVEDAVSSISGIEEITSYSQQGLSLVMIQFALEEDIDIKTMDIRSQLDGILWALPEDAEDPVVWKFQFSQFPVITLAFSGPQHANELYRIAQEDLKPLLSQVPGVADVGLTGGQRREIDVLLSAHKLRKHGLSIGEVVLALQATNVDLPAGHITQKDTEYIIRATSRFEDVAKIRQVRVPSRGSGIVTVGDLGDVRDTYEEARTTSRFDGNEAVILTVQAQSDANEVDVVDGVLSALPDLVRFVPPGASLDIAEDTSVFVRGALANVKTNMLIGIALTAVALYLFLKSWRATVIVAVVMPAAVISTFTLIRFSGFTLNIISLTGMAIVIGVLVNNAILVLENVSRFVEDGLSPREAAIAGTKDIALAILSSTATNLVVFLPIAFMGEIIGKFFRELGLTVVYATVFSLVISFSLTPMMCGLMLRDENSGDGKGLLRSIWQVCFGWVADLWQAGFRRGRDAYLGVLDWCLSHRVLTFAITAVVFFACLRVFGIVGGEFMPPSDEGVFRITVQMPVGTPLEVTDEVAKQVEESVKDIPYLQHYYSRVGTVSGFLGGSSEGVNLGEVSVTVADRADRPMHVDDLMNELRPKLAAIPGAKLNVEGAAHGPGGTAIEIQVSGDDLDDIKETALRILRIAQNVPGAAGVTKSWQTGHPEVRVVPRQKEADRHQIDVRQVAEDVRAYVEGRKASQFRDGDENYDILVKLREEDRQWATDIERMFIGSPKTGGMVPIGQVAEVREAASPTLIMRKDRRRLVTVGVGLTGERKLDQVLGDIKEGVQKQVVLPQGVRIDYGGEVEFMQKNFMELFKAIAIAAVLTFLCVAGIIESFLFGIIIIMALPISLIGVALAMFIGGVTINIFSLMAMVILVGMVVNNAIIVVDYAMRQEAAGRTAAEVIREACRVRYRMIIMANLTTVVALIPLSLGIGFGGEIFRPLAVVQMGGVAAAAVLSLLVIPVAYAVVGGRHHRS